MKRPFRDIDPTLTDAEIARISEILETLPIANKNLSWLEALVPISNGKLLAKILYKLQESDLKLVCRVSKLVNKVCKRYQLHERFYTGKAYMFGSGVLGRLGDGSATLHTAWRPQRIQNIPPVKAVSCGLTCTALITLSGEVYMFGQSQYGNFGDGVLASRPVSIPQKIENIPQAKAVSCFGYHTGVLTVSGDVYMFGNGEHGRLGDGSVDDHDVALPRKIENIPPIKAISCSMVCTGIVAVSGEVYMFGQGTDGNLGDGDEEEHDVGVPRRIENIPPIESISCGLSHTGIVTVSGDVYMFGWGYGGKLGDGDKSDHAVAIPRRIENIPPVKVISCGFGDYTGIVTVSGEVYMFGDGEYGILGDGIDDPHYVSVPRKIQNIPPVRTISTGSSHSGIVTVAGDVYMFGRYRLGILGLGLAVMENVSTPQKIRNIPLVASISCGYEHTGFVTIPESSLDLTIDCQYCGVNQAIYHDHSAVFCSQQCQRRYYFN